MSHAQDMLNQLSGIPTTSKASSVHPSIKNDNTETSDVIVGIGTILGVAGIAAGTAWQINRYDRKRGLNKKEKQEDLKEDVDQKGAIQQPVVPQEVTDVSGLANAHDSNPASSLS